MAPDTLVRNRLPFYHKSGALPTRADPVIPLSDSARFVNKMTLSSRILRDDSLPDGTPRHKVLTPIRLRESVGYRMPSARLPFYALPRQIGAFPRKVKGFVARPVPPHSWVDGARRSPRSGPRRKTLRIFIRVHLRSSACPRRRKQPCYDHAVTSRAAVSPSLTTRAVSSSPSPVPTHNGRYASNLSRERVL